MYFKWNKGTLLICQRKHGTRNAGRWYSATHSGCTTLGKGVLHKTSTGVTRTEIENISNETLSIILCYLYKSKILITEILELWYEGSSGSLLIFLKANLRISNCMSNKNIAMPTHCEEMISTDGNFLWTLQILWWWKVPGTNLWRFLRLSTDEWCATEENVIDFVMKRYFINRLEKKHWLKSHPKWDILKFNISGEPQNMPSICR